MPIPVCVTWVDDLGASNITQTREIWEDLIFAKRCFVQKIGWRLLSGWDRALMWISGHQDIVSSNMQETSLALLSAVSNDVGPETFPCQIQDMLLVSKEFRANELRTLNACLSKINWMQRRRYQCYATRRKWSKIQSPIPELWLHPSSKIGSYLDCFQMD